MEEQAQTQQKAEEAANIDNTVKKQDNKTAEGDNNGSETAVREGLSDGRGNRVSSDNGLQISDRGAHDGERNAGGVSEGVRLSEGKDLRSDQRHSRAILLDEQLKKVNPNAKALEFKRLDSNIENATKFKKTMNYNPHVATSCPMEVVHCLIL